MQGMSEREYAARAGLSRGAIQKAKLPGGWCCTPTARSIRRPRTPAGRGYRPVKAARGVLNAASPAAPRMKPVPNAAVAAVGDTLREHGLPSPSAGGATFLQAKTANEVLKSQERRLKLQKLKGELVDRARAEALVFRLARETRDAWVNWPARAAALIAAEVGLDPAAMQKVLEAHVRAHLDELAEGRIDLG